ncbi:MAG: hypothetical protein NTY46_14145 [Candidatus Sumerlaeota bacterium]|nr:hypothetical protein [Candidatus Sumerlaeota bacterium]
MKTSLIQAIAAAGAATALWVAPSCRAAIINVPGDYDKITSAVAAAAVGDTINIAAGTYNEPDAIYFTPAQNQVTVNCAGSVAVRVPDNKDAAIFITNDTTTVTINGMKIERPTCNNDWMRLVQSGNGSQAIFQNCIFNGPANGVGIILFDGADVVVRNSTFGNFNPVAEWAGAITCESHNTTGFSDILVEDCTFTDGCNKWFRTFGGDGNYARVGAVSFLRCTMQAAFTPMGIFCEYRTMYDGTKDILFQDCVMNGTALEIAEFHYTDRGGPRSLTFQRVNIPGYDGYRKVMWYDLPCPTLFEDVLIGGGKHNTLLRFWGGPPSVNFIHCTFVTDGVTAGENPDGTGDQSTFIDGWDGGRTFQLRNCLFYTPVAYSPVFNGDSGSTGNRIYDVDYSIIQATNIVGSFVTLNGGAHYSNQPIKFVDAAARNYHLAFDSPAINAGIDLGYSPDLAGVPRPSGPAVDMGCYEYQQTSVNDWQLF